MGTSDTERVTGILRDAGIACDRAQRPDLRARVEQLSPTDGRPIRIVVIGEFRVGKGSTINALLGSEICPTASGLEPHGPITVRYGDHREARVWPAGSIERGPLALDPAAVLAGDYPDDLRVSGVGRIEVDLPLASLRSGLTFVDTPSTGGLASARAIAEMEDVREAEAVLFVTSAAQPLTRSELTTLQTLRLLCSSVTVVLNKIDYHPSWREVRAVNSNYLREAGLDVRILPISARLALLAGKDQEMLAESGLPTLGKYVRERVVDAVTGRRAKALGDELAGILQQIESVLASELGALEDPASTAKAVAKLEREAEDLERSRRSLAAWQTVLADSFEDLVGAADRQLKDDFSLMVRESESVITKQDPRGIWPEMQAFANQRSAWILARTVELTRTRCVEINEDIARRFGGEAGDSAEIEAWRSRGRTAEPPNLAAQAMAEVPFPRSSKKSKAFVGVRGLVGGLTMFSVASGFAVKAFTDKSLDSDVAIILASVIGTGMARTTMKEKTTRELEQSRQAARTAVRRYCDEVMRAGMLDVHQIAKDGRRILRDHYASRADEAARTIARQLEALRETKQRARTDHAGRANELRKELSRLSALQGMVERLGEPSGPAPATKTPVRAAR